MRNKPLFTDRDALTALCHRRRIRRPSLFGSELHVTDRPDSDADLLSEFEPDATPWPLGSRCDRDGVIGFAGWAARRSADSTRPQPVFPGRSGAHRPGAVCCRRTAVEPGGDRGGGECDQFRHRAVTAEAVLEAEQEARRGKIENFYSRRLGESRDLWLSYLELFTAYQRPHRRAVGTVDPGFSPGKPGQAVARGFLARPFKRSPSLAAVPPGLSGHSRGAE
jgi:hypothetical protein